ncbi:hypothetical protein PG989_015192 [Apiospora arundinis]
MVKKSNVPNAWEDDWESQADKEAQEPAAPAPPAPLTKKERLAQHAELNRKIWETAYVSSLACSLSTNVPGFG